MKKNRKRLSAIAIVVSLLISLPALGGTMRHTYDDLNRLVRTEYETFSVVYVYDKTGNRKSEEIIVPGSSEDNYCRDDSDCEADQVCRENTGHRFNSAWYEDRKICVPENCGDWDETREGCLFGEGTCNEDSDCKGSLGCGEDGLCGYCEPKFEKNDVGFNPSQCEKISVVSYRYDKNALMRLTIIVKLDQNEDICGSWIDTGEEVSEYVNVWIDRNNDGVFGDDDDERLGSNISQKVKDAVNRTMIFETDAMDISDIESDTAVMRVVLTQNVEPSDPCSVGGFGDAKTVTLHFAPRIFETDCGSPTIISAKDGTWGSPSSWDIQRVPDENDIVLIRQEHVITDNMANSDPIKVRGLCNEGELRKEQSGSLDIEAKISPDGGGFIYNEGFITGFWHNPEFDVPHQSSDYKEKGDNGGNIRLEADILFHNGGIIWAGNGEAGYLKGGDGGSVTVIGKNIVQTAQSAFIAGRGGNADGQQTIDDEDPDNDRDFIDKSVFGGKGGNTSLKASESFQLIGDDDDFENARIFGGNGGNATLYHSGIRPDPALGLEAREGKGGDMTLLANDVNFKSFRAESGGSVFIDPETITAGPDTRIRAGEDVVIFGGNDWVLDLRGMSEGAVTAGRDITLSVGENGVIDLRGNTGNVFSAGGQVRIFSDAVMLDDNVSLEDLADAAEGIVTGPARILRRVTLNGPGQVTGQPGADVSVGLTLVNAGPEEDTYTLSVSDSAGRNPDGLPSSVTLGGLEHENLSLDMTLPSLGETNVIVIRAVSVSDPDTSAEAEVAVSASYPKNSEGSCIVALEGSPFKGDALTIPSDHPLARPDSDGSGLSIDIAEWADYEGMENVETAGFEIHGTSGADRICGSPGKDVIFGYGGDDHLESREGDDVLNGGAGSDHFIGGTDADVIIPGDADGNGTLDLCDAISVISVLAELDKHGIELGADVNGDRRIGTEEVIHILKMISEKDSE